MWLAYGLGEHSGFHFNLNSGEIPRGGVLGKTVHVTSAGVTFTCVRRGALSHTGVLQKLYEFIFRILFLSETSFCLKPIRACFLEEVVFWACLGFLDTRVFPLGSAWVFLFWKSSAWIRNRG